MLPPDLKPSEIIKSSSIRRQFDGDDGRKNVFRDTWTVKKGFRYVLLYLGIEKADAPINPVKALQEFGFSKIIGGRDALERLTEAESFLGSSVNHLFFDDLDGNPRQRWLDSVRTILIANGIEIENLSGRWKTTFPELKK